MRRYTEELEKPMQLHFSNLNEKDRRHYAAVEAMKLGYGGQKYICELFGISPYRVRHGIAELENPALMDEIPVGKQRRVGGGRKKKTFALCKSL